MTKYREARICTYVVIQRMGVSETSDVVMKMAHELPLAPCDDGAGCPESDAPY